MPGRVQDGIGHQRQLVRLVAGANAILFSLICISIRNQIFQLAAGRTHSSIRYTRRKADYVSQLIRFPSNGSTLPYIQRNSFPKKNWIKSFHFSLAIWLILRHNTSLSALGLMDVCAGVWACECVSVWEDGRVYLEASACTHMSNSIIEFVRTKIHSMLFSVLLLPQPALLGTRPGIGSMSNWQELRGKSCWNLKSIYLYWVSIGKH